MRLRVVNTVLFHVFYALIFVIFGVYAKISEPGSTVSQTSSYKAKQGTKQVQDWMTAEHEFAKLDVELQKALGNNWDDFKRYMSERIQQHHAQQNCKMTGSSPMEECYGQASLTESEFILHQAIDRYSEKFGDRVRLHRYHNLAHLVFEKTRQLLTELSLIQESEFHPTAVSKQNEMIRRYKRAVPLPPELTPINYEYGYLNSPPMPPVKPVVNTGVVIGAKMTTAVNSSTVIAALSNKKDFDQDEIRNKSNPLVFDIPKKVVG